MCRLITLNSIIRSKWQLSRVHHLNMRKTCVWKRIYLGFVDTPWYSILRRLKRVVVGLPWRTKIIVKTPQPTPTKTLFRLRNAAAPHREIISRQITEQRLTDKTHDCQHNNKITFQRSKMEAAAVGAVVVVLTLWRLAAGVNWLCATESASGREH